MRSAPGAGEDRYVPVGHAAKRAGLTRDYVARLCKRGALDARLVGSRWYVDPHSLDVYVRAQSFAREHHRKELALQRVREYAARANEQIVASVPAMSREVPVPAWCESPFLSGGVVECIDPAGAVVTLPPAGAFKSHAHDQARDRISGALIIGILIAVFGAYSLVNPGFVSTLYGGASDALSATGAVTVRIAHTALLALPRQSSPSTPLIATQIGGGERDALLAAAASPISNAPNGPLTALAASAGAGESGPIATEVNFSGETVAYGDIISYDPSNNLYTLSSGASDPHVYGIVVQTPALLFKPGSGGIPVARFGAGLVNVTLENGPIAKGDELTSSSIPGKAMKADAGQTTIGVANEPFSGVNGVALREPDGTMVLAGTISMQLEIGATQTESSQPEACSSFFCNFFKGHESLLFQVARYVVAGLIAVISLVLAFRSFMSDVTYGVISMGRNPLARASIVSMVVFNAFLVVIIGGGGLLVAIVVLFAG